MISLNNTCRTLWSGDGETTPVKRSEMMLSENRILWDRHRKLKNSKTKTDKKCAARAITNVIILASLI